MKKYAKQISTYNTQQLLTELKRLITEDLQLEWGGYSILLTTGGIDYTLERIATDLYFSPDPINSQVRKKLRVLYRYHKSDIPTLHDHIKRETFSWSEDTTTRLQRAQQKFIDG